jgi:hypothetical protein
MMVEMTMALGILVLAVLPVAFSILYEMRICRVDYYRAVAMEIVDGEMEVLAAGEWHFFSEGTHEYTVRAAAAKSLPPGRFMLTIIGRKTQLEWLPQRPLPIPMVKREAVFP